MKTLPPHSDARATLTAAAQERILVLDGAMGTMIQQLKLDEVGYRGERFKDWHRDVRGNNDLLVLTRPDAIRDIHLQYFLAGADICETNTFSATSIVMADYGMEALAYEMNVAGARLAREAAQIAFERDGKRRFVAGALGPLNKTASMSTDVNNPGHRNVTFDQIADFCGLHPLEVKGIADGEVARDIRGADPIANGQLNRDELDAAEKNPAYRMKVQKSRHAELLKPVKKAPRYTPVSRRQDRPDAIAWFVRNHPEVPDSQVARLLGTTKATIDQVRDRTHWNSPNIKPVDPVTLGLATQLELDAVVRKAADKKAKDDARRGIVEPEGDTLRPASETGAAQGADQDDPEPETAYVEDAGSDDEDEA